MHPGGGITAVFAFSHPIAVPCEILTLALSWILLWERGLHQLDRSKEIPHENNAEYEMHKGLLIPSSHYSAAERNNLFSADPTSGGTLVLLCSDPQLAGLKAR